MDRLPPALIRLLADDTRWQIVQALRWSDRSVSELVALLGKPQNLVSYHLQQLRDAGLARAQRSDADGRATYYHLDPDALDAHYQALRDALGVATGAPALPRLTVAFICTRNSARSQIAEGWLRTLSGGDLRALSAGVTPTAVHPLAIRVMAEVGVDIAGQQAKGLEALAAEPLDVAVSVCDRAREVCGVAVPASLRMHWSIPDPVLVTGDEDTRLAAFRATRDNLRGRVMALLSLLATQPVTAPALVADRSGRTA
ncbi:MAG: metalloregulator ArsR/SmtB family transcription factor [Dehalococcoidia bacterium]|nr:metalloregulator ArsR/SmtB family transcription factor [Dehalococcoidia bacterium]